MRWQICFKRAKHWSRWRNALKIRNSLKMIKKIKFTTIEIFKIKTILTCAKDTTIALKMRKNARNNKINLIIKIVAMKSFIYFCKSRIKRMMIRKTTEIAIIVKRKNILQRIILNSNKIIFKSTLWKTFDKTFNKTNKKHFYHELSSKFRTI